jgi:hypothetical protein
MSFVYREPCNSHNCIPKDFSRYPTGPPNTTKKPRLLVRPGLLRAAMGPGSYKPVGSASRGPGASSTRMASRRAA